MEIKVEVTSANLAGTVEEVFRSLSPEARERLAADVMLKFLTEPHGAERKAREVTVIEEFRRAGTEVYRGGDYYKRCSADKCTDDEIRASSQFREVMDKWKSTREVMVATITAAAVAQFQRSVDEMVRTDPQIQQVMRDTLEEVRKNFPAYTHDAMMAWFVQNMQGMASGMMSALMHAQNADEIAKRIQETARQRGLPV